MPDDLTTAAHSAVLHELGMCITGGHGNSLWCNQHDAVWRRDRGAAVCDGLDSAYALADAVVEAAEPFIRANERAKARSRVAGLPVERRSPRGVALVERVRVLAAIDGGNDD